MADGNHAVGSESGLGVGRPGVRVARVARLENHPRSSEGRDVGVDAPVKSNATSMVSLVTAEEAAEGMAALPAGNRTLEGREFHCGLEFGGAAFRTGGPC